MTTTKLYEMKTPEGAVQVTQADPEHVTFAIGVVGDVNVVHLGVDEAVKLAVSILIPHPRELALCAARLPEPVAAELGVALLSAPAVAALLRKFGHGHLLRDPGDGPEAA